MSLLPESTHKASNKQTTWYARWTFHRSQQRVICAHSCVHLIMDARFVAVRSGSIKPAVSSYSILSKHLSFHSAADKDSLRPELLPVSLIFRRGLTFRGRNFFTSCFYRKGRDSDLSERQCHVLFTTEDAVSCNLSRPESTQEFIRGGAALEIRYNLSANLTGFVYYVLIKTKSSTFYSTC